MLTIISVSALFYKSFITQSYEQSYSEDYIAEEVTEDQ